MAFPRARIRGCWATSCAESGASPGTWFPISARAGIFTKATRRRRPRPKPQRGDIVRGERGSPSYVVYDCGAIGDICQGHKAAKTAAEGVAMAVKAGTDLDCGLEYENVVPAVREGLLTEKDVDTALRRLLTARFKLGMFDPPEMVRWAQIPY